MNASDLITNSMLWAAYGDALGFITELSDRKKLKYRTGGLDRITNLIRWKRKIGGRYGVSISLPEGCYSDDTQLRLGVCRSIKKDGKFDFETFSKIELPVFLAYGLGKGRGTKVACESLRKKSIQWNTNFFETKDSQYINMGGNGAAMRIQPHVWVAYNKVSDDELISEIMRDSIITHGNPIAWIGALFHGFILKYALINNECPTMDKWVSILNKAKRLIEVCKKDDLLNDIWIPNWERISNNSLEDAVERAANDMLDDINIISQLFQNISGKTISAEESEEFYHTIVKSIDALNPTVSGSAIKTALLSSFLGYYFSKNPIEGLKICVNTLGSDTDTIATMAGALFGVCNEFQPPEKIMDIDYIIFQAERLTSIYNNKNVSQFSYPDLLHWKVPNSQIDLTGSFNDKMAIYGLGELNPEDKTVVQKHKNNISVWRFAKTSFGQTMLLNHREKLKPIPKQAIPSNWLNEKIQPEKEKAKKNISDMKIPNKVFDQKQDQENLSFWPKSLDEVTDHIIKCGFNETDIGNQLLSYAEEEDGVEKAISFAAIIVKAKRARIRKKRNSTK